MSVIQSTLSTRAEIFKSNQAAMQDALDTVNQAASRAMEGGGDAARERHLSRGKL
ncbi:MAG: 3-methylcrotonyl-CoA carboxylase beta subunit, partial [Gammaproteobacteria bacterium]